MLGATTLFVLPSTSPANAAVPWDERLRWFTALRCPRLGEVDVPAEDVRPPRVVALALLLGALGDALPAAVLELDARRRVRGKEAHLDLCARDARRDLPRQHEPVRRVPLEQRSPSGRARPASDTS